MKTFLLSFLVLFVGTYATASGVEPVVKSINVASSSIGWKGYKVLGSHEGIISFKSGNLNFDNNMLVGGDLVVDMTSINCTDLKAGAGKEKLEGHLKSDDFFGIAEHPTSSIKITKVVSRGKPGEYKLTADLTIKNVTKQIKFDAVVGDKSASAALKIDRSDFNIKYGSGSFFDNLGDKTIYDEFDLNINIIF